MTLRGKLVRLAYTQPQLRKDILPFVKIAGRWGHGLLEGDSALGWIATFAHTYHSPQAAYRSVLSGLRQEPGWVWDALGMWSLVMASDYTAYKNMFAKMTPKAKAAATKLQLDPWVEEWDNPEGVRASLNPILAGRPGVCWERDPTNSRANKTMSEMFDWFGPRKRISLRDPFKLEQFALERKPWIIFLFKTDTKEFWRLDGQGPESPVTLTVGVYGDKGTKSVFRKPVKGRTLLSKPKRKRYRKKQGGYLSSRWKYKEESKWMSGIETEIWAKLKEGYIYA